MLPQLENFIRDALITSRPVPISILREQTIFNYPEPALRELLMNACMHRDYQSNMPIRLYQFDNRIEILNAGGLYGEPSLALGKRQQFVSWIMVELPLQANGSAVKAV